MQNALVSPATLGLGGKIGAGLYRPFIDLLHHKLNMYFDCDDLILDEYRRIAESCDFAKTVLKLLMADSDSLFLRIKADTFPGDIIRTEISVLKEVLSDQNLITDLRENYTAHSIDIKKFGISIIDSRKFSTMFNRAIGVSNDGLSEAILISLKTMVQRKSGLKLENLHNDSLVDMLRMYGSSCNFTVSDQARAGESPAGGIGSLDLYIFQNANNPFCVIECLCSDSFGSKDRNITTHFNKLLDNYDKVGFSRNYLITYCEAANFGKAFSAYGNIIRNINNDPDFTTKYRVRSVSDRDTGVANVKLLVTSHEREGSLVQVFHYFADLSQSEKVVAKMAKLKVPPPHKFSNPANPQETYSGRGRAPAWYRDHLLKFGNSDAMRIQAE